jgi:hypothetical protein
LIIDIIFSNTFSRAFLFKRVVSGFESGLFDTFDECITSVTMRSFISANFMGAPTPRMENSGTDSNSLASSPLFWTVNSRPFHVDAECFVKMRFGNCPQWCEFPQVRGMEVMPSKAMFIITSVRNLENLIKAIP